MGKYDRKSTRNSRTIYNKISRKKNYKYFTPKCILIVFRVILADHCRPSIPTLIACTYKWESRLLVNFAGYRTRPGFTPRFPITCLGSKVSSGQRRRRLREYCTVARRMAVNERDHHIFCSFVVREKQFTETDSCVSKSVIMIVGLCTDGDQWHCVNLWIITTTY